MKVAIYARVSTDDGRQDLTNQLVPLRKFVKQQPGWSVVHVYQDEASGKNGDRASFKDMMRDASRRDFDLLLFWSLDRLTREGSYKTLFYLKQLSDAGVKWKSYTEQYLDTAGIFGEAIAAFAGAVAHQQRLRISENTKAGLARARARGQRLGRRPRQLDWDRIHKLRADGKSFRTVAKIIGCSSAWLCAKMKERSTTKRRTRRVAHA